MRALYDFQEQCKAVASANGVCEQNKVTPGITKPHQIIVCPIRTFKKKILGEKSNVAGFAHSRRHARH